MPLSEWEPKEVFRYFQAIARIPHGSGNTGALAEMCLAFAKEHSLRAAQDAYGNVVIYREGTPGYRDCEPVILQGHLDMVCEKCEDCGKDMAREGLDLFLDGHFLGARGTTLGGDDGIAVAYILAILADDTIPHPPIEALLTADEEIGLCGAAALDASLLNGRRLINLDSEEEGVFTVSCAGASRVNVTLPVDMAPPSSGSVGRRIVIDGLRGGHSGMDIAKNRPNAIKVLAELLRDTAEKTPFGIASLQGGGRLNAITRTVRAEVCLPAESQRAFDRSVTAFADRFHQANPSETEAVIQSLPTPLPALCTGERETKKVIFALTQLPYGVRAMTTDIPDQVRTSCNPGEAVLGGRALNLGFMVRSNVQADRDKMVADIRLLAEFLGGRAESGDDYPAWEYRPNSPLREMMAKVYEKMRGKPPCFRAIHAGLECGILGEKLKGADMISIGPNMMNVHTPSERLDMLSVARVWDFLLETLKNLTS